MGGKTHLKQYNKVGYRSSDIAGNVVYVFLTSFVTIYLTDTIGLVSEIIGILIAVSRIPDGFADIIFGSLTNKTHTRLGRTRPWMIYEYIGCAVILIAVFTVPISWGKTVQYAWFFIAYILLNGVFYTANNIAYSAPTSLVTKNSKGRIQMGSYRLISASSTSLLVQSVTVIFVDFCGGGAEAWGTVAITYVAVGLIVNTVSGLSVKELPEEELVPADQSKGKKYSAAGAFRLVTVNKHHLMICGIYTLQWLHSVTIGAGTSYTAWVLKSKSLFGVFSWAVNILLIITLISTPTLAGKWSGMYKLNLRGYTLVVVGRALVVIAGRMESVPLMLLLTAAAAFGQGSWQGDTNAMIASCSEYTYLTKGRRVEGTIYSCTSLGIKLDGGTRTTVVGWLLELSGYVGTAETQPESCISMSQFMYLWLPLIFDVLIMLVLSEINVEEANGKI